MNYQQALDFIHERNKFGSKLGLENTFELMRRLGDPHKKLRFVHVAGTNGKGSTCAYLAHMLMAEGYKTGMYISPFVYSFNERIQVNNTPIPPEALAECTTRVAQVLDETFQPTEFEVVTAIGLLYFLDQQCDYVVLEVGLGGRFDSTNVIPSPDVAVITSISIDHTQQLGNTVGQIAFEKAGIIKTGTRLALYPDNPAQADEVIHKVARERQVPVAQADKADIERISQTPTGTRFRYRDGEYQLSMLGPHQVYNAVTAITAAQLLGLSNTSIYTGLKNTRFAGRLQVISQQPLVIVDGAHNHSGVLALKAALCTYFTNKTVVLVMGMLRDKEYQKCVADLAPVADLFIATSPNNPRALPADKLADVAQPYCGKVIAARDRDEAVSLALGHSGDDTVICICGSLYLIGDISLPLQ